MINLIIALNLNGEINTGAKTFTRFYHSIKINKKFSSFVVYPAFSRATPYLGLLQVLRLYLKPPVDIRISGPYNFWSDSNKTRKSLDNIEPLQLFKIY